MEDSKGGGAMGGSLKGEVSRGFQNEKVGKYTGKKGGG